MDVRLNADGSWVDVVLTDEEVIEAKTKAYETNLDVINRIAKQNEAMPKELVAVLANAFVKHVHYFYEEAAKIKVTKPVAPVTPATKAPDWK